MRSPSGFLRTGARDLTGLRAGLPALSCRAPYPKMLDSASSITRMRTARMVGVAALVAAACTAPAAVATRAPSPHTTASPELTIAPSPLALPTATPRPPVTEPFRCTERVPIPEVEHVVYGTWTPDATKLAISRIVTLASPRTSTG